MIFKLLHRIKYFLFILILSSSLTVIYIKTSKAANPDQTITCNVSTGCSDLSSPLFDEDDIYPTQSIIKTLEAINNYPETRTFAVEVQATNFSDSNPSLADVLSITISEIESGIVVYGPSSINEWLGSGYILLTSIPSGASKNYEFKVDFGDVDNDYQKKALVFDLNLGFEAIDNTISTTTSSFSDSDGGNDASTVIGTTTTGLTSLVNNLPSIFGLQTEEINLSEDQMKTTGDVQGLSCFENNYIWWLPLIIQLIFGILIVGYFYKKEYKAIKRIIIIILALALISQAVHQLLGCNCATSPLCEKYWLLNIFTTGCIMIIDAIYRKYHPSFNTSSKQ